jgi:hypothetical protein
LLLAIGAGRLGAKVWKARDRPLDRVVAIKFTEARVFRFSSTASVQGNAEPAGRRKDRHPLVIDGPLY